jgi:RNA polymerase sigma-70 factor, ECF subfamily
MPVDSLSESAGVDAQAITREPDCTTIESSRGRRIDPGVLRLNPRSGRSIFGRKSTARAEVEGGSGSDASETTLARFEQTITQDRPRLLWLAQRIVRRREIAEEIVQESLLKAFRALPRFRGESRMRTWLCAIVRNTALEHLRNQRDLFHVSLEDLFNGDGMSAYDPPDSRNNPEDHYKTAEMQIILRDEVDGLGPGCRGAFQMCILEENTQSEAAATFNVSVAKIKSRVCRAKRILSVKVRQRTGVVARVQARAACPPLSVPPSEQ